MYNKKLTTVVCSPSLQKKATRNVSLPYDVVTTEKANLVPEMVEKSKPGRIRLFHVPSNMALQYSKQITAKMNGHTPQIELVKNPHEKQSIDLPASIKVIM